MEATAKKSKNYAKGIFVTSRETKIGPVLKIGITEDFITYLKSLPKSEKGYYNLECVPQKDNPNKLSVYEDTWKPNTATTEDDNKLPWEA